MRGTLIFDGRCGFCTRAMDLLTRIDRHGRVETRAAQEPGVAARAGIAPDELAKSVWWVHDSDRCSGAAAINSALAAAIGRRLPLTIYRLPGVGTLQEAVYRRVAANRHRLPGTTPWCQRHPDRCAE